MTYKLSNYLIKVGPVINNKYHLLYSTRSAEKTLISVKLMQALETNNFSTIDGDLLEKLIGSKTLVHKEENELEAIIKTNKDAIEKLSVLSFVLHPTSNCQLGCNYCGQEHTDESLNDSSYTHILDRIEKKLKNKKKYTELAIGWFGAEPLLGLTKIRTLTPKLKQLASSYGCHYSASMTTNGLSLKKPIYDDLVENYNINSFEITLDGSAEYHNQRRHTKEGLPTFDLILRNLTAIVTDRSHRKASISLRCNVDKTNREGVLMLLDILEAKNILPELSKFYIAPIHSWGNDAHQQAMDLQSFANFEIDFLLKLLEKGYANETIPSKPKNIVCVALHEDSEVIDSRGNIYNCTEIPQVAHYAKGENIYKIDNLYNSASPFLESRPLSGWNEDILQGEIPCSTCKILPICGGACPKAWYEHIPPCPSIKLNIEQRLIMSFHKSVKKNGMTIVC